MALLHGDQNVSKCTGSAGAGSMLKPGKQIVLHILDAQHKTMLNATRVLVYLFKEMKLVHSNFVLDYYETMRVKKSNSIFLLPSLG